MCADLLAAFLYTEAVWRGYNIIIDNFCNRWHLRKLGSCLVGFVIFWMNSLENVVENFYNIGITPQVNFDLTLTQLLTLKTRSNLVNRQSYIFPPLFSQVYLGAIFEKNPCLRWINR